MRHQNQGCPRTEGDIQDLESELSEAETQHFRGQRGSQLVRVAEDTGAPGARRLGRVIPPVSVSASPCPASVKSP